MYKKFLAELIGTFGLAVAVNLAAQLGTPIEIPVIAALVVGIFVYTVGPISGTHLNPAVTLGALSLRKISVKDAAGYLIAQFAGAGLALAVGAAVAGSPSLAPFMTFDYMLAIGEAFGAAILTFGIASVVFGKTPSAASGAVIGGSLLVGIIIGGLVSQGAGILNPAVALAVGALDLTHVLGPIAGSLVGFWSYRALV